MAEQDAIAEVQRIADQERGREVMRSVHGSLPWTRDMLVIIGQQAREIDVLREALEWYADPVLPYAMTQAREPRSAVQEDAGRVARAALAATEKGNDR